MFFDYFDMLSGGVVYMNGVGHLRSPWLHELKPTTGLGQQGYNLYLNILSWDKAHVLKYGRLMNYRGIDKLDRDELIAYDVITLIPAMRELCRGVLSFFMLEEMIWDEKNRRYVVIDPDDTSSGVGEINRSNFDDVRAAMLQLNYIGLNKEAAPISHSSDKSKELWEKAQEYLRKQAEQTSGENKPEYRLSNIISKVCSIHPSYNLLNVYDLTVFQLYDAFFQLSYMRSSDLSERIFSNHGGDKFHFEDWLRPIQNNI